MWFVCQAGKSSDLADESVLECLQPPTAGRPITPPEQARFRKSTTHASGKIVRHPGFYDDSFDLPGDEAHGVKTKGIAAESMAEVIKNYPESQIMQWRRERQEDIYHSCVPRSCMAVGFPCCIAGAVSRPRSRGVAP